MRSAALAMTVALAAGQGAMDVPAGGGRCKSECSASVSDGFKCDRCSTGLLSSDYCVYPGNATFETKSFQDKGSYFWEALAKDQQHAEYPNASLFSESVRPTFYNMGDEMPAGRKKAIHGVGAVCRFKMENAAESPYTGLFEPGQQEGFIRLGSAVDYSNGGLTPGLGIKFPRTGRHSGNFVALRSLDFGQSWNFFASNLSNHIPPPSSDPKQKVIVKKFNQASNCPTQVGLSDMAMYSQNGKAHGAQTKFPFKLFLVPSKEVQTPDKPKTIDVVNAEMNAFPIGTTLYTVYACGKPAGIQEENQPTDGGVEKGCGEPLKLADMVTTTKCIASAYGDKAFQIRHQPVEEDWQADPSILKSASYNALESCGWTGEPGKYPRTSPNPHPPVTPPARCTESPLDGMLADDTTIV